MFQPTPVANLRTSERRDFKRCPQRWWWGWRQGMKPKGEPSDALWFGIGWHLVMAHWYKGPGLRRGPRPINVWKKYVAEQVRYIRTIPWEGAQFADEKYVEAGKLGELMLEHYFDTYGHDEHCYMIAPEQTFQVMVPLFGPDGQKTGEFVEYDGTFDGVYRNELDELWLWEHKTAKAIRTGHLHMDDQAGSYWAVATATLRQQGLIGKKESLTGIMYNFARKAPPDDRPRNAQGLATNKPKKEHFAAALAARGLHYDLTKRNNSLAYLEAECAQLGITVLGDTSAVQPPAHFLREPVYRTPAERNTQIRRIGGEASVMQEFRNGALPLYKNPTVDCSWDCNFFELCKLHEQYPADDAADYARSMFAVEDPYADHRKSASSGD